MNKDELKKWFLDKLNGCYTIKNIADPYSILWFYDESFVRKLKLSKINNTIVTLPNNVSGKCIFKQDKLSKFLWCDYNNIWEVFEINYSDNYREVSLFISEILKSVDKLKLFRPEAIRMENGTYLVDIDIDNLKTCTPDYQFNFETYDLLYTTKNINKNE